MTGRNVDHRKQQLIDWLHTIAPSYAVSVLTYAVMSNHFHLVVYYDPQAADSWSDEDVARRWIAAHPSLADAKATRSGMEEAVQRIVMNPDWLNRCRRQLGSLSDFMKCLKQPVAQRANAEDKQDGHFWSKRFYSGAILSEDALLSVMAYVDLNPIRAKITRFIERAQHTGLAERLSECVADPSKLEAYLEPSVSGLSNDVALPKMTLSRYRAYVQSILALEEASPIQPLAETKPSRILNRAERWWASKQMLKKRPRAIGDAESVKRWTTVLNMRRRKLLLPTN